MSTEDALVTALAQILGSQRRALVTAGLSRSTWHYRRRPRPGVADPVPHCERDYPARISDADRDRITELILAAWAGEDSVDQAFADAWDDGVMLASRRTWWRIAAQLEDQMLRPKVPTRKARRTPRNMPVLEATGPGQVWSWDIERHEALLDLAVVKGHRWMPVAAGV